MKRTAPFGVLCDCEGSSSKDNILLIDDDNSEGTIKNDPIENPDFKTVCEVNIVQWLE